VEGGGEKKRKKTNWNLSPPFKSTCTQKRKKEKRQEGSEFRLPSLSPLRGQASESFVRRERDCHYKKRRKEKRGGWKSDF